MPELQISDFRRRDLVNLALAQGNSRLNRPVPELQISDFRGRDSVNLTLAQGNSILNGHCNGRQANGRKTKSQSTISTYFYK